MSVPVQCNEVMDELISGVRHEIVLKSGLKSGLGRCVEVCVCLCVWR